jgi:hypothetical protein
LITVVSRGKVIHSTEIDLNQSNHNIHVSLFNEFYYSDKTFLGGLSAQWALATGAQF